MILIGKIKKTFDKKIISNIYEIFIIIKIFNSIYTSDFVFVKPI